MTESAPERFKTVARAKLDALVEVYDQLEAEPPPPDGKDSRDKALYQRQSAGKALLTHIMLLRKLLGLDALPAATAGTLAAADYRAMVAALHEEVGEDG